MMRKSLNSDEKRGQMWLSDLCVKYGELSVTPSASSLSSSCYSGSEFAPIEDAEDDWNETASDDTSSSYEYYWSKSNTTRSNNSVSDGHDGDESSEGEDVPESKTPIAQVYSYHDKSLPASAAYSPLQKSALPPSNSIIDLAAPFGDPLKKWQDSKNNLLIFGPSNYDKASKSYIEHDDAQSVSTVSGSGMDFFRKFVQRRGPKVTDAADQEQDCKECENQFRREVLIDRLVSDSLSQAKKCSSKSSTNKSSSWNATSDSISVDSFQQMEEAIANGNDDEIREVLESSCSSGKCPAHQQPLLAQDETASMNSYVSGSTVSGTGLLFLRNYLKKKKDHQQPLHSNDDSTLVDDYPSESTLLACNSREHPVFNNVPIPFPPKNDFYGPATYIPDDIAFCSSEQGTRRNSVGSTIADLLNDNFDSEDSELRNLDWEEWDDEGQQTDLEELIESDDASIVVDILDMAKPVVADNSRVQSEAASELSFVESASRSETNLDEPSFEELQNVKAEIDRAKKNKKKGFSIPFLDLPSPPSSTSSGSITPKIEESCTTRSLLSTPRQQDSGLSDTSSPQFSFESFKQAMTNNDTSRAETVFPEPVTPKKRLAEFWERRVSGSFESSINSTFSSNKLAMNISADSVSKFKPALPSYYDPEGNKKANEKIQKFLDATRKAADDSVSTWSSNYEKLQKGELFLNKY